MVLVAQRVTLRLREKQMTPVPMEWRAAHTKEERKESMRFAHCCLLGVLVLGGGTALGGNGRIFFMPAGEDPSNSTPGENFVVTVDPETTLTMVAYIENVGVLIEQTSISGLCSYASSSGGGDMQFAFEGVRIDTTRPDYLLAFGSGFPALDFGQCLDDVACNVGQDCPGNSTCVDNLCTLVRPRAGIVSFGGPVFVTTPRYIGELDYEIPADASGEYKFIPACLEIGGECLQIGTGIEAGALPIAADGLTIRLPDPPAPDPVIVHEDGLEGQTRPFSGYIDPRSERNSDLTDAGVSSAQVRFNTPVFGSPDGFALTTFNFFVTQSDGNSAPDVTGLTDIDGDATHYEVVLDRPITPQVWTTIRVVAFNADGTRIADNGNQGPGVNEVDRIDIGFLPCDVDQSGSCSPIDLFRFRQLINNPGQEPDQGTRGDVLDMDRNDMVSPVDLFRFRQLINGVPPATIPWSGQSIGSRP